MQRRTLLRSLAAAVLAHPFFGRTRAATQAPSALREGDVATLAALAAVVLPSALDEAARDAVVRRFTAWVRNYRAGVDRGHGYGSGRLSAPTGPSPADGYPDRLAALDRAAVAAGARSFGEAPLEVRRAIVIATLNAPEPVTRLPGSPTGANLVADFMGFYFNGPDAYDLCYQAAIGAERCRPLAGSENPPPPLGGR